VAWGRDEGPGPTLLLPLLPWERAAGWPEGLWESGGAALLWLRGPFPRGSLGRCESLVEVYFQLQQQVMAASAELGAELLPRLLERFNEVLSSLVKR